MIRALCLVMMMAAAAPVSAQDDWPYAAVVHDCYDSTIRTDGATDCLGDAANICMETEADGHTTTGMMFCLSDEAGVWDDLLNEEYAQSRAFAQRWDESDLSTSPQFAVRDNQVLQAQRAWIAFRDANCTMAYGRHGAGTLRQVSGAACQMRMTAERVFELARYRGAKQ
ncbi:lysozyme inhibitor LprI family protein [Roseobacter sp. CCS2]|uniref:lysozyme inhibitor LprI family protein n=1 Tax=Roseobacter sp. CCS2 TaxID=391593 RepID=UPI0000F3FDC6|nr:lysozyme inhibitor LprI family protein [Roseobacter sp. CCS2]EBA10641.1 hypothetical protein RCCS2_02575 [Roseobacter sp. CCS2]